MNDVLLDKESLSTSSGIIKAYVDAQFKLVSTRVDTNETEISSLTTTVSSLKTTVDGLPLRVKYNHTNIMSSTASSITNATSYTSIIGYNALAGATGNVSNSTIIGYYTGNAMTAITDRSSIIGPYAGAQTAVSMKCANVFGYNAGREVGNGVEFSEIIGTNCGYGYKGKIYNSILIGCNVVNVHSANPTHTEQFEFNTLIVCEVLFQKNMTVSNSVGLGYRANPTGSNQVVLGNSETYLYLYGPSQVRADTRDMQNVTELTTSSSTSGGQYDPIAFIKALAAHTWKCDYRDDYVAETTGLMDSVTNDGTHVRERVHSGFTADAVKAAATAVGFDFAGYQDQSINGGLDVKTVGYGELLAPMVVAIKYLLTEVESLKQQLDAHTAK